MGESTAISWCDRTWSPWYGCTQVSMGARGACEGCYARQLSEIRMGRVVFGGPGRGEGTRDARAESAWAEPLRWNRTAPGAFVFPSMCDPFDNHPDLAPLRRRFVDLIRATPNLTWLLLTKRPGNIVKLFRETLGGPDDLPKEWDLSVSWPRNAAVGCTVVTQEEADRDIPKLLAAKAALRPAFAFVSMEPLLGPVDLTVAMNGWTALTPAHRGGVALDWVITGGETDQGAHKARPSHPDWYRQLRDQCAAAGVAYHHKQNGEWSSAPELEGDECAWVAADGRGASLMLPDGALEGRTGTRWRLMSKPGKKAAGRALDGVTHDARPVSP